MKTLLRAKTFTEQVSRCEDFCLDHEAIERQFSAIVSFELPLLGLELLNFVIHLTDIILQIARCQ